MEAAQLIGILIAAIGGLLLITWGIVKGVVTGFATRILDKLDTVETKVDAHNESAIQRLTKVETKVDSIAATVDDLDQRVRHIEMKRA